MRTSALWFLIVLLVATMAGTSLSQPQDCVDLQRRTALALSARDVAAAKALFGQLESLGCDAVFRRNAGYRIASLIYDAETAKPKPDEAVLKEALKYGRPWQLLATLGDLAASRKSWAEAAGHYQDALAEINDLERTPNPPTAAVIETIRRSAEQCGLLSPDYVPTRRMRDGSNGGLAARRTRGVDFVKVAMPVEFEYNQTSMTAKGRDAAADMALFLKNDQPLPKQVRLIGHTDERGQDAYNLDLSRRRAEALAHFLKAQGVGAAISVEGRGEGEPYPYDQPEKYTQEERWQMDRRVELVRE